MDAAHMTVLLVDDDEAVARLAARVLQRLGHDVETYLHPEEALARVTGAPDDFDVVITDHRMPGMTGAEMLVAMHEMGIAIPAMVVSGFADEIDLDLLRSIGVGPVLEKPYTKAEMQARIDQLLSGGQSRQA